MLATTNAAQIAPPALNNAVLATANAAQTAPPALASSTRGLGYRAPPRTHDTESTTHSSRSPLVSPTLADSAAGSNVEGHTTDAYGQTLDPHRDTTGGIVLTYSCSAAGDKAKKRGGRDPDDPPRRATRATARMHHTRART